jgi:hypothetical protein
MTTFISTKVSNNPVIVRLGVTHPPLTDTILRGQETINTEGIEVKFFMRPLTSRVPLINGELGESIWPKDAEGHNVKYQFVESDVAVEGEYFGWWGISKDSEYEETLEFPIIISDHGPGLGIKTGAIVDGVADHMPTTLYALIKDPNFGERRVQKYAVLIQERVLGKAVEADEEAEVYPLVQLDYFSKRLAFELCSPGIDYWARQARTKTAQSPTEITSYPEAITALEKLRDRLCKELEQNWRDLQFLVFKLPQRKAVPMPASSLEFDEGWEANGNLKRLSRPRGYVTKDPFDNQPLYTGYWGAFDPLTLGFYPFP